MGEVIEHNFRRTIPPAPSGRHYTDLAAIQTITADLAWPAFTLLITGAIYFRLREKNGTNIAASLEDLKDFVRSSACRPTPRE